MEYIYLNPFTPNKKITTLVIFFPFKNIYTNLRDNIYF
jgi:hypothetical protein